MKVKVKFKNEEAKRLYLEASENKTIFPFKKHDTDFCYDAVAVSCEEIAPNVYKYGLGISLQIIRDKEDVGAPVCLSIDARPRSSIYETGMVLSNAVGTVDEGYTGEVSAVMYHLLTDMPKYNVGDRICQLKIGITSQIEFVEVETLDNTTRGDGGYGSTGK
jgi:dUTP pyrophosphatase